MILINTSQRIKKLTDNLAENEAALISSYPNVFYYSGFTSEDAILLISHEKQLLVTDSRYTLQAHEQCPDFEIINITVGLDELFKLIKAESIGFEEQHLTVKKFSDIEKKLPQNCTLTEMQKVISFPRRIKDKDEIKLMAKAEHIGDKAFSYILGEIEPGMSEREIAIMIEFYMKEHGASSLSFPTISAAGERSALPHGMPTERKIRSGDFLTLDFGCIYNGYCSDMTRTVVIGKASARQKEIYSLVYEAQQAALAHIKPGVKCSTIDAVARKVITDAGYGKNFGHALGHSVGIEIHENPSFSPKCDDVLESGMLITDEPGIYIEDFGGVRIEDLIAVTDTGMKDLTSSDKSLIEI